MRKTRKKNEKGLSLITLAVSILVMILILTTIVISANGIIEDTRKKQFAREIELVESSFETYTARNSGNIDISEEVNINVSAMQYEQKLQFEDETLVDGMLTLKVIDLNQINVSNVTFGNQKQGINDRYLVSLKTGKVYYEKGLVISGKTYYKIKN